MRYIVRGVLLLALVVCVGLANYEPAFSSDLWKAGGPGDRAGMLSNLDHHVLKEGMTTAQCYALLGEPDHRFGEWNYAILPADYAGPSRPVALTLTGADAAALRYEGTEWQGSRIGVRDVPLEQLEPLRAAVSDQGIARWCANEPGARPELAEAVWSAVLRGWLTNEEVATLQTCADSSSERWAYEMAPTSEYERAVPAWLAFEQQLNLHFEDSQLQSWGVWQD